MWKNIGFCKIPREKNQNILEDPLKKIIRSELKKIIKIKEEDIKKFTKIDGEAFLTMQLLYIT